jgi:hypothetical protein
VTDVVVRTGQEEPIHVWTGSSGVVVTPISPADIEIGVEEHGPPGPPGPQGPSGTMVVAVPFSEWPPADPQPNTLYLRLAP